MSDTTTHANVDLTNCDREPIHRLGKIQSYGALIAVSSDWLVQHASVNLHEILGVDHDEAIGRPLTELIVSDGFDRIRDGLRPIDTPDGTLRLFGVSLRSSGRAFDLSLHQSGSHLIIEFEPKAEDRRSDIMAEVYPQIAGLQRDQGLEHLSRGAARALQALSGFDSVMVYQFQPDNSGKVIAERRADGKALYRGMYFPASDIPVQARALYKRSLLRLIADVNDPGVSLHPGTALDGQPLDLSLAVTRAVSPIHIEYLRNMGVEASMSVSIMKDGELWGLFACHHHSPRYIDYEKRTAIEMFAHLFSYELSRAEEAERKQAEVGTRRLQSTLLADMANGRSLSESLLSVSEDLEQVIPHDGLILFENETFYATGIAPTEEEFLGIARTLDRSIDSGLFETDRLSRIHHRAADYPNRCAGLLAIPISKRPRDYLVLCRRQVQETVTWAGDPTKPATVGPNGLRLTPRKSFEAWLDTVSGRSAPWRPAHLHAAEVLRTILLEVFLKVTDAAYLERKRAQEQQQLLISELNHRVRNILNLMRGLVAQTKGSAKTVTEFTECLDGRIQSLARAHDQLTNEKWEPASLRSLIACEFEAYADEKSQRVQITGPEAMISPKAYTAMALVLHEMVTNSIKYGALCDQSGTVAISLSFDRSGGLIIEWTERGGPPVVAPTRRGFGSVIIETSIPHELRGDAEIDYRVTGVEARFRLPPNVVTPGDPVLPVETIVPAASLAALDEFRLTGRGMVLEDAMIIAMDAAALLEDLGAKHVEIVATVADALAHIAKEPCDFALLDVNLGEEQSISVAEKLHELGVPFVLATGYGSSDDLIRAYPPCEIVQKPFSDTSVRDAFARAISARSERAS